jgi:hypothetical protein
MDGGHPKNWKTRSTVRHLHDETDKLSPPE